MTGRAARLRVGGVLVLGTLLLGAWYLGSDHENPGVTRNYYLAAEEVDWDYAPSGRDLTRLESGCCIVMSRSTFREG
jgi:hypothetical protein